MFNFKNNRIFVLAYEESGDTVAGSNSGDTVAGGTGEDTVAGGDKGDKVKVPPFTPEQQEHVNGLIKKERETTAKKQAEKVEQLLKGKNLSDKQRGELSQQLENLRSTYLTKEQQAAELLDRERKTGKDLIGNLEKDRDGWKSRFTKSTIQRSITDAALEEDAYSPRQIEALLEPLTSLVEALDAEGKPTGKLTPKVKFADTDKEGKSVTLEISPSEAVKKMRTIKEYDNLFRTKAAGGLGGSATANRGKMDVAELAKDPVAYREARKKGLVNTQ